MKKITICIAEDQVLPEKKYESTARDGGGFQGSRIS
jgi:hypothetical protein